MGIEMGFKGQFIEWDELVVGGRKRRFISK